MGQERSVGTLNKLFCKGAKGALVVADITDHQSIENSANWKKAVDQHIVQQIDDIEKPLGEDGESIPMMLVLNKYDLVEELVAN